MRVRPTPTFSFTIPYVNLWSVYAGCLLLLCFTSFLSFLCQLLAMSFHLYHKSIGNADAILFLLWFTLLFETTFRCMSPCWDASDESLKISLPLRFGSSFDQLHNVQCRSTFQLRGQVVIDVTINWKLAAYLYHQCYDTAQGFHPCCKDC